LVTSNQSAVPPVPDELIASVMRMLADAEATIARAPMAAQAADFMIRELLERELMGGAAPREAPRRPEGAPASTEVT